MLKKIILSLAIGWTFLIFVLCLVNFNDLPTVKVSGADKYGHFVFHFVFTVLWGIHSWLVRGRIMVSALVKIIVYSLFLGIIIEFLQDSCTQTRQADPMDVVANLSGAITAFVGFILIKKIRKI